MITLVKKINGTYRSKLKTRTPVVIGISKSDLEILKRTPRDGLDRISAGQGNERDWFNLMFRARIGYEAATLIYTEEAKEAFEEVQETCMSIVNRYKTAKLWTVTQEEKSVILLGLDAVDQMLLENTRRIMLEIFKSADRFVTKIIKELNTENK